MSSTPKKSSTPSQPTTSQARFTHIYDLHHSGNVNVNYAAVFNASAAATSRPYASDLGHVWGSAPRPNAGVQAPTSAQVNSEAQGGTAMPVTAAQLFNNATNASAAPAAAADLAHFWDPGTAKRNT